VRIAGVNERQHECRQARQLGSQHVEYLHGSIRQDISECFDRQEAPENPKESSGPSNQRRILHSSQNTQLGRRRCHQFIFSKFGSARSELLAHLANSN
jgi:hypothetical protein